MVEFGSGGCGQRSQVRLDENIAEFSYKINRRTIEQLGNDQKIGINRLATWSAVSYTRSTMTFSTASQDVWHDPNTKFASQLELDINTVPDQEEPMSPTIQQEVFSKLVDLGSDLAQRGDLA